MTIGTPRHVGSAWRLLAALLLAIGLPVAAAADFPDHPVRIIVPFAPGGGVDGLARVVAQRLQDGHGQSVVVENRAGSNGTVGGAHVLQSPPDGYTLLLSASTHIIARLVMSKAPYDPVADFTAIARIGESPLLIVMSPGRPQTSLAEVIADARANPDRWTAANAALGSPGHVAEIAFASLAGIKLTLLPYRGTALALNDVAGGHVPLLIDAMVTLLPMARSGNVKALAFTSARRSALAPDIPTAAESGLPGLDMSSWYGVWSARGMAPGLVARLNAMIGSAAAGLAAEGRLATLGITPVSETPEQFSGFIAREVARATELLQSAGFKPE